METLVQVFVAALLSEIGGKSQAYAHAHSVAGRGGQGLRALTVTCLVSYGIAAFAGMLIAPLIAFDARSLLMAIAIAVTGLPMFLTPRQPLALHAEPNFGKSIFGFSRAQLGDGAQFLAFAFAARNGSAGLALAGAVGGVVIASFAATMLAKNWPSPKKLRWARYAVATLLTLAGAIMAINALQLA